MIWGAAWQINSIKSKAKVKRRIEKCTHDGENKWTLHNIKFEWASYNFPIVT